MVQDPLIHIYIHLVAKTMVNVRALEQNPMHLPAVVRICVAVVGGGRVVVVVGLHLLLAVHLPFAGFHFSLPAQDIFFDPFPLLH